MHHGGNGAPYPSRRDNGIRIEKHDIFGCFGYRAHIEKIFTSAAKQQGVHIFYRSALALASAPYLAAFISAAHEHEYSFKPFRTFERPNDNFVLFLRLARAFGEIDEQNKRRIFFVVTAFQGNEPVESGISLLDVFEEHAHRRDRPALFGYAFEFKARHGSWRQKAGCYAGEKIVYRSLRGDEDDEKRRRGKPRRRHQNGGYHGKERRKDEYREKMQRSARLTAIRTDLVGLAFQRPYQPRSFLKEKFSEMYLFPCAELKRLFRRRTLGHPREFCRLRHRGGVSHARGVVHGAISLLFAHRFVRDGKGQEPLRG